MATSPLLAITYPAEGGTGNVVLMNTFLRALDALSRRGIKDRDLATPPGSPADGDSYIVATGGTGAWASKDGKLAVYASTSAAWEFYTVREGWVLWIDDENIFIRNDGTNWHPLLNDDTAVALTDAATIAVDVSKGKNFKVTLAGNRTLGLPTGTPYDGMQVTFRVRQDATGSRTLAYDAIYRFSTTRASPTLSTAAAKEDYLAFRYNATDTKWDIVNIDLGH